MGRAIDVDELKKKFEPKQAYFTEGIFRKIDETPTAKPEPCEIEQYVESCEGCGFCDEKEGSKK